MSKIEYLVYDCEILEDPTVLGWDAYEDLGITVIGTWQDGNQVAYDMRDPDYLRDFQEVVNRSENVLGFNSRSFDDPLCKAHGVKIETTLDLLEEIRLLSGQPRQYTKGRTRRGYDLGSIAAANGLGGKSGSGAEAPTLWKQGRYKRVIDYCLNDVLLTWRIFELMRDQKLVDPTNGIRL